MAKITVLVHAISIYSSDAGGRVSKIEGRRPFHKEAVLRAFKWGLFREGATSEFDGSNIVRVPSTATMILKYDEKGFELFMTDRGRGPYLIASGTKVEPAINNPQWNGGHTVYASDKEGFDYSFHGRIQESM